MKTFRPEEKNVPQQETLQEILSDEACKDILRRLYTRYIEQPKVLTIREDDYRTLNAASLLQRTGLLHRSDCNEGTIWKLTPLGQKICYYFLSWHNVSVVEDLIKSFQIDLGRDVNILDVGCGSGSFLTSIGSSLASRICAGLDIDMEAVILGDVLQEMNKTKRKKFCLFIAGDVHALPFKNGTFDVVICNGSLQYFDVKVALSEMARVAGDSACFYFGSIHAPGFYLGRIAHKTATLRDNIFSLINGVIFRLIGRQMSIQTRSGCTVRECALMPSLMEKLLGEYGIIMGQCKISRWKWGVPIFLEINARR